MIEISEKEATHGYGEVISDGKSFKLNETEVMLGDIVDNARAIIVVNVSSRDELAAEHYPIYEELY